MAKIPPIAAENAVLTEKPSQKRLLIVEDDPAIQRMLGDYFRHAGYEVITASDGETGARLAVSEKPVAMILDLMLPKLDGLSVCREVRGRNQALPIIMLTAKDDIIDKVVGLEMGADDYLTKPFSLRELEARLNSVLRRAQTKASDPEQDEQAPVSRGKLKIDFGRRTVSVDGKPIELTPKEFELLSLFASHPGHVYSRKYLLENVWDYSYSGYDRTIDSHINRLRAKIEQNPEAPQMILTVWGVGYKFNDEY